MLKEVVPSPVPGEEPVGKVVGIILVSEVAATSALTAQPQVCLGSLMAAWPGSFYFLPAEAPLPSFLSFLVGELKNQDDPDLHA